MLTRRLHLEIKDTGSTFTKRDRCIIDGIEKDIHWIVKNVQQTMTVRLVDEENNPVESSLCYSLDARLIWDFPAVQVVVDKLNANPSASRSLELVLDPETGDLVPGRFLNPLISEVTNGMKSCFSYKAELGTNGIMEWNVSYKILNYTTRQSGKRMSRILFNVTESKNFGNLFKLKDASVELFKAGPPLFIVSKPDSIPPLHGKKRPHGESVDQSSKMTALALLQSILDKQHTMLKQNVDQHKILLDTQDKLIATVESFREEITKLRKIHDTELSDLRNVLNKSSDCYVNVSNDVNEKLGSLNLPLNLDNIPLSISQCGQFQKCLDEDGQWKFFVNPFSIHNNCN